MLKKTLLLLAIFIFIIKIGFGQDAGLHFQRDVWQSNFTNPSFMSNDKYHLSVHSFGLELGSNLSFNELLTKTDEGYLLEPERVLDNLDNYNYIQSTQVIEMINYGHKFANIFLSFNNSIHINMEFGAPKDVFEVAAKGNAHLLGRTLDFGPNIDLNIYSEIGLSAAMKIKHFSFGGRVKYLNGIANLKTIPNKISIITDGSDIYQITATTDYQVHYATFVDGIDFKDFSFGASDIYKFKYLNSNKGFGLDFGINYSLNDKLNLSASIIDLGTIKWKSGTVLKSQGTYTYEGLDLKSLISNDSLSSINLTDTLLEVFNFEETHSSYTQKLDTKVYLSGRYKLNEMVDLYALYLINGSKSTIGLHGNFHLGKIINLGTGYYLRNYKVNTIGFSSTIKLGKFQLYVVTENIFGVFKPYDSKLANVRFGLNIGE